MFHVSRRSVLNRIETTKGRLLFECIELKKSYSITLKVWNKVVQEYLKRREYGEVKYGMPYPPSAFAVFFEDLYESGGLGKAVKTILGR